jgi:chromosome segregation ATPase
MSIQLNDISYKPISLVRGETREWLMQISSPSQAIEELIAKISVLEEELEISREQVQTLKDELSAEQQKVERYQEELEACQSEMEALNFMKTSKRLMQVSHLLLPLSGGILMGLTPAPVGAWSLAWIALVPLMADRY